MKQMFYSSLLTLLFLSSGFWSYGQSAKQYVLFEHFTNASCGPCAAQNPAFQDNFLKENDGTIHHIAYHPWWPGSDDPFYQFNIPENTLRTNYYSVSGVPRIVMRGDHWEGQPTGVSWPLIRGDAKEGSSVRLVVNESTAGNTRNVKVELEGVNAPEAGTYLLRCAVVEKDVSFDNPPGTNGETYFPNVFRQFVPGASSKLISLPAKGASSEYNFSYTLDNEWDASKIYVIAFLQEQNSKEILNSGSSFNCGFELMKNENSDIEEVSTSSSASFSGALINLKEATTEVKVSIVSDAPGDWSANFELDGQTFTQSTTATLNSRAEQNIQLNVQVGSTAGIGEYTITVESLTDPEFEPQNFTYYVISEVKNLVVNNDQSFGNGKIYDWSNIYLDGLMAFNANAYGSINSSGFASLVNNGGLQSVDNVYYNVGWTLPPFTSEMVDALEAFLDAGGNLLISGQDIAWAAMDNSSQYRTLKNQTFLKAYLGAEYVSDGNILNSAIFPNESDSVFGERSSASLKDVYGSFYPDELKISSEGASKSSIIYYYNAQGTKPAAIRTDNGNYKTVYLAFGLEQMISEDLQEEILATAHAWFNGLKTGIEFDKKMAALIKTYPNPATDVVRFDLPDQAGAENVVVFDMTGKRVATKRISGNTVVDLDVSGLDNGFYLYEISNEGSGILKTGKFAISK